MILIYHLKIDSKLTYPVSLTEKMIDKFCKNIIKS